MSYSTTNSLGTVSVAPGVGLFLQFPVPHGGAFVAFLHAIKTNPHPYPGVARGITFIRALLCLTAFDARKPNMFPCKLRLNIIEISSFCLLNLLAFS